MRPLRGIVPSLAIGLIGLLASPAPASAQQVLDRPLRVFLDCDFYCDQDFFTQEVPWVRFVRDRQAADVHVLGTRQTTGAGGSAYTLEFQGRDAFEEERLTLRATTAADATASERRTELLEVIRLGLAPFAASTSLRPEVEIFLPDWLDQERAEEEVDPWNRWVFRVGVRAFANGESQQGSLSTSGNADASRVTDAWKLMVSLGGSVNRTEFELSEGETFTSRRESYSGETLAVKSLGPHWGVGGVGEWTRSTYNNYDHSAAVGAAVEYNVFPYAESTRRLLTFLYAIGPRYNVYQDSTIFAETEELLVQQLLVASYDVTQPWGNIDVSTSFDHYVAKFSDGEAWDDAQYNLSFSGGVEVRLIQGLSADVFGRVSMVRGQIQLAAEGLTEEEILTQQRELATDYRYFLSFGLSYRFGSIFSDVVNPRFEGF